MGLGAGEWEVEWESRGLEKVFLGSVTSTLMQGNLKRVCQAIKHRKRTPSKGIVKRGEKVLRCESF